MAKLKLWYDEEMNKGPRAPKRPETAKEGATLIQQNTLKLFATTNGKAVDWTLMAESLFRVAFYCLDRSTDPARRASILQRVEAATYDGLVGNRAHPSPAPDAPAPEHHNRLDPPAPEPGFTF